MARDTATLTAWFHRSSEMLFRRTLDGSTASTMSRSRPWNSAGPPQRSWCSRILSRPMLGWSSSRLASFLLIFSGPIPTPRTMMPMLLFTALPSSLISTDSSLLDVVRQTCRERPASRDCPSGKSKYSCHGTSCTTRSSSSNLALPLPLPLPKSLSSGSLRSKSIIRCMRTSLVPLT